MFATVIDRQGNPASVRGRTPEDMEGPRVLKELVRETGGNIFRLIAMSGTVNPRFWRNAEEKKTILAMATRMYLEMGVFCRREIKLLQQVEKPRNWQPEVLDEKGKRRRGVSVVYPRRLTPCTAAAASQ